VAAVVHFGDSGFEKNILDNYCKKRIFVRYKKI
jgi:hypothetical protein